MPKAIDITGKRFGRLVAIEPTNERTKQGDIIWKCKCDCGNTSNVSAKNLKVVKSCGCSHRKVDLKGKRYGSLVVVGWSDVIKNNKPTWECKCDCGKTTYLNTYDLTKGRTRSCGCLQKDVAKKIFDKYKNDENYVEIYNSSRGLHDGTMECILNDTLRKDNTTGVRGVYVHTKSHKFISYINYKGKHYHIGSFDTLELAKEARKIAEKEIWGKDLE